MDYTSLCLMFGLAMKINVTYRALETLKLESERSL